MEKHEIKIPDCEVENEMMKERILKLVSISGNGNDFEEIKNWLDKDMEKHEIKIPSGCEVDKITTEGGSVVITFKMKEQQYPKTWEEFCEMYPIKKGETNITPQSGIYIFKSESTRREENCDRNVLPDLATAEAVLALCQLIQLRECYNQGWVPDWTERGETKHVIRFCGAEIFTSICARYCDSPLYFKTNELRDQFLGNFRGLIEKLKPLYGIKEGGEE